MDLLPNLGDPEDPKVRARYGYLQSGVSIGLNLSLFATKLVLWSVLGSIAVLTDAFNGLGDVAISATILLTFRYASLEADERHPFGHGRLEQIAALIVAAFLIFIAALLLVQAAFELADPSVQGSLVLALVLAGLAGVKELLARFSFAIAQRIDSDALRADAWNHRYDALLTASIALAIYLVSLAPSLQILDPVFGIFVSLFIVYTGATLLWRSGEKLLGRAPSRAILERIVELTRGVPGVRRCHDISIHDYGTHRAISLTIQVGGDLTVEEAHRIATEVKRVVNRELRAETTVHVEPP
ncbi:MAG: cation diffusion facilitator family transporter [Candidatus Thermoplasmatota archaeon]|nr:cation diffusion facilitator family transporter [Candidatus Thermoplasmatota archaeon]